MTSPLSPTSSWPRRDAEHLLVQGAQMAALEEELFRSGLPVEALMEKAALAISHRLLRGAWRRPLEEHGAVVLVGPGHNGGDGLVVARELHLAGIAVEIWSPFERHKPLTEAHRRHALWLGIPERSTAPDPKGRQLWIDALFGTGQTRPPAAVLEELLQRRHQLQPGTLVAIDSPTGLCCDTGTPLGKGGARAHTTFCLGLLKQGLVQDSALAWVGTLERVDLGLPAALLQTLPTDQPLGLGPDDGTGAPWPQLDPAAGKYQRGRLLVVAGSSAYRGAARLCLAGARASGCGSVTAAIPMAVADQLWQVEPQVVLAGQLTDHPGQGLGLAGLAPVAAGGLLRRHDAVVLGPGIGPGDPNGLQADSPEDEAAVWQALGDFQGLLLLDADGLNRLARRPAAIDWLQGRRGPTWLTPHAGEWARLFPDLAGGPPLEAAVAAARRSGCDLLLKGAHSVVASADGRRWQVLRSNPAVARAGLGDVLAGYAGGWAARALAAGASADGALLACIALAHANAGLACGGATDPLAIAECLASQPGEPS